MSKSASAGTRDLSDLFPSTTDQGGRRFLLYQADRVRARYMAFRFSVTSVFFWGFFLAIGAWLDEFGLRGVFMVLLVAWILISIPAVLVQLGMILDIAQFALTHRTLLYPVLHRRLTAYHRCASGERLWGHEQIPRVIANLAVQTSPISGISTWCYYVLSRLPGTANAAFTRTPSALDRRTSIRAFSPGRRHYDDVVIGVRGSSPAVAFGWIIAMYYAAIEENDHSNRANHRAHAV